jgi:hypothetical protein
MKRDSFGGLGRRYFSHSPLHSYHFWVVTVLLLIVLFEAAFYTSHLSSVLGPEAMLAFVFPAIVGLVLWFRVLVAHRQVFDVYRSNRGPADTSGAAMTDTLLNNVAYMLYAGFALSMFALGCLYAAAAQAITAAMNR